MKTLDLLRRLGLVGLVVGLGFQGGCQITPDPCAGYTFACLNVTVPSGPENIYQLEVTIRDYGSETPFTPTKIKDPLVYPLRFAVRFAGEFDPFHRGKVLLHIAATDGTNQVVGEAEQEVMVSGIEKVKVTMPLGNPFPADLRVDPDLRPPADLTVAPDLTQSDLADGSAGG